MDLCTFYRSKEWLLFRLSVINDRYDTDGFIICEHCGKPIVKSYDIIAHHKEHLTEDNVNDFSISLNPDNIALVHHVCHNYIHNKLGYNGRKVYLVYGAPLSCKTTWVNSVKSEGDLIIDMDSIWQCISGCDRYIKPNRLKSIAFKIRNELIDCVKFRYGKWNNAYVIGGYPLNSERERLCKELGAEPVYIDCSKEECIERLNCDVAKGENLRNENWEKFIDEWFERYTPPPSD